MSPHRDVLGPRDRAAFEAIKAGDNCVSILSSVPGGVILGSDSYRGRGRGRGGTPHRDADRSRTPAQGRGSSSSVRPTRRWHRVGSIPPPLSPAEEEAEQMRRAEQRADSGRGMYE